MAGIAPCASAICSTSLGRRRRRSFLRSLRRSGILSCSSPLLSSSTSCLCCSSNCNFLMRISCASASSLSATTCVCARRRSTLLRSLSAAVGLRRLGELCCSRRALFVLRLRLVEYWTAEHFSHNTHGSGWGQLRTRFFRGRARGVAVGQEEEEEEEDAGGDVAASEVEDEEE